MFQKITHIGALVVLAMHYQASSARAWDWSRINVDSTAIAQRIIAKQPDFLLGTALAEAQNSPKSCPESIWESWEAQGTAEGGYPTIQGSQRSGTSCDFWHQYPQDIEIMKKMGVKSLRFSVDWSAIEPREGVFDTAALDHYVELCTKLRAAGIIPMVTLHHFSHPVWFQNLGGFEKTENIVFFTRFATRVFEKLSSLVPLWCTINEPGPFILQGYIRGCFPPGKVSHFQLAGEVLKNLLIAHCMVYDLLKAMPNGKDVQIGLVHNVMPFEPYHCWNLVERLACAWMNGLTQTPIMNFLKTGKYSFTVPFDTGLLANVKWERQAGRPHCDFIGLNYYSRVVIYQNPFWWASIYPSAKDGEFMTDMPYACHPEGLYDAIAECATLDLPIYITENGIGDRTDDRRATFIGRYLHTLSRAIEDGYDVRGYYYWTLVDNFEWDEGYHQQFGLCSFDPATQVRTIKAGAAPFIAVAQALAMLQNTPT